MRRSLKRRGCWCGIGWMTAAERCWWRRRGCSGRGLCGQLALDHELAGRADARPRRLLDRRALRPLRSALDRTARAASGRLANAAAAQPGSTRQTHMPDLGFLLDGKERWAVEFERTSKGHDPLAQILEGYREAQLRERAGRGALRLRERLHRGRGRGGRGGGSGRPGGADPGLGDRRDARASGGDRLSGVGQIGVARVSRGRDVERGSDR